MSTLKEKYLADRSDLNSGMEEWANSQIEAANERIRELKDELEFKLAELELMVRSRSSIKELLITEREVSDKLITLLKTLEKEEDIGPVNKFKILQEIVKYEDIPH